MKEEKKRTTVKTKQEQRVRIYLSVFSRGRIEGIGRGQAPCRYRCVLRVEEKRTAGVPDRMPLPSRCHHGPQSLSPLPFTLSGATIHQWVHFSLFFLSASHNAKSRTTRRDDNLIRTLLPLPFWLGRQQSVVGYLGRSVTSGHPFAFRVSCCCCCCPFPLSVVFHNCFTTSFHHFLFVCFICIQKLFAGRTNRKNSKSLAMMMKRLETTRSLCLGLNNFWLN